MKTQTKNSTYEQLFKHVQKHVKNFREDLTTHDRNSITKHPGVKFIHITRPCGTALIFLDDIDLKKYNPGTTTAEAIEGQKVYFDHYMEDSTRKAICFFDGESVKKVNEAKALQIFAGWIRRQKINEQIEAQKQKQSA